VREDNSALLVKDIRGLEDMFLICFPSFFSCGGDLKGEGKRKSKKR